MDKTKKVNSISIFKKFFGILLIILLVLNMLFVGMMYISYNFFWINIGVLGGISYLFYKN